MFIIDQKAWSIDNKECSDHFQSPININHNDLILNDSLKIEFHNYNQPSSNYRVTKHGRSGNLVFENSNSKIN